MKWGRRHKSLVVAGVLLLVITALGLLASTIVIAREHAKTKLAYQRVVEERAAAEQSFLQARQAVDTFTQLGEEELISKPSMYQLRRKFLETSLDYYETFLEQRHNDGAVQAELVATRQWVAKIVDELTTLSSYGPLMLLADERVQEELEIGVAQQERIEGLIEDLWSERSATVADERLTREGRQHQLAESLRVHADEIAAVVGPLHMRRVRQIALQQQGPFAFKRPEVIEALALTTDQRKRISEITETNAPHRSRGEFRDHPFPANEPPDWHGGPPPKPRTSNGGGPTDHGPPPLPKDGPIEMVLDDGRVSFEASPPQERDERLADDRRERGGFKSFARRERGMPFPPDHHHEFHGHGPDHGPPGPRDLSGSMKQTVTEIKQVLTPAQLQLWNELVGEPVTFDLHYSPESAYLW